MKYACIQTHLEEFDVTLMCRILGVSRSGFYAAQKRALFKRTSDDQRLQGAIRSIFRASHQRYGSPRVHQEVQAHGFRCSRKRVERLMRADGLRAKSRRRYPRTTNSSHSYAVAPNVLERRFAVEQIAEGDRVWVSDRTYVPTRQGWRYLAVVLDVASRRVVGWAMKNTLHASLACDALAMALARRAPSTGLIHHADRGVQYASSEYQALLTKHGCMCSMSRRGNCWDNAVAERFFATLEWELIAVSDWHTHQDARQSLFAYLEIWYNRKRRHSALGYMSPTEYEAGRALRQTTV